MSREGSAKSRPNLSPVQIDLEIDRLKEKLDHVEGTKTEVYTRIVGYYRSVANWNKGKREEYGHRRLFSTKAATAGRPTITPPGAVRLEASSDAGGPAETASPQEMYENAASYTYFYRKSCPNCPPVKQFLETLKLPGNALDVDTGEGMDQAARYEIMSAPSVIFFDAQGRELLRAHDVKRLEQVLIPLHITV